MKKKLLLVTLLFVILLLCASILCFFLGKRENENTAKESQLVAINELVQLAQSGELETLQEKAGDLQLEIRRTQQETKKPYQILWLGGIAILFLIVLSLYLYIAVLRPFDKMCDYAERLAQGNFDIPLHYERSNYFGEFTWAFDSMRKEITKARAGEKEAIENNKTVIATLSHDIKTPISSIRAYAEGLEAHLDSSPEKRAKYLKVMMKKCDEVSKLTNDLFLHSLSDLDKLKIVPEQVELCGFLEQILSEFDAEKKDIHFKMPDITMACMIDKNRFTQMVENIINNGRKYAKTDIDVSITRQGTYGEISFRDYGTGIPDADMPFICDKFYRGRNVGTEQGSGLGLYIVQYVINKMDGELILKNHADGLEIVVKLPVS